MKIREISIRGLFGSFNYTIPLNLEDKITILHGPNGFGKTILLRFIHAFFNANLHEYFIYPFDTFQIVFDDESTVYIEKTSKTSISIKFPIKELSIDVDLDSKDKFSNVIIKQLADSISTNLITTQRLLKDISRDLKFQKSGFEKNFEPTILSYSREIKQLILTTLGEYARVSQSLDSSFPARLIQQKIHSTGDSEKQIREKLMELDIKRKRLVQSGLLEEEESVNIESIQTIESEKLSVLSLYIQDLEKKLNVMDSILLKLELFKKMIAERFQYKKLIISKENGFQFLTDYGVSLEPTNLSSGEQHVIILLYEMLFKIKENSLVLIDEPELSLHIAWQQGFIKDLLDITKLSNIDILMATHSPDIIHDRWDLTVALTR